MSSDRIINYQLRPSKNVERKMIRDTALRLIPFSQLNEYQYIGFGAKYFVDFFIFHRSLHIKDMISIEKEIGKEQKYEFNKPFSCIEMKYGEAGEILPGLNWEKKSIVWLDYDGRFNKDIMDDIDTIFQNCSSGSLILLSFNSTPHKLIELKNEYNTDNSAGLYIKKLKDEVGEKYIPLEFEEQGMSKATSYSEVLRKAIHLRIENTIAGRNISFDINLPDYINTSQILNFFYKDGAAMTTIGYIVYSNQDKEKFENCKFENLDFFRNGSENFEIRVPNFTTKEIKELMQKMPNINEKELSPEIFPPADVKSFSKIYKYFPYFIDTDFL